MIAKPDNSIIQVQQGGGLYKWVDYTSYRPCSRKKAIQKLGEIGRANPDHIFRLKFEDWSTGETEVL